MKKIRKHILGLTLALGLVIGLAPVTAHAEWRQNDTGWCYTEGSSYATGWRQIDGKWYYFNTAGNMLTGWITDKGVWYYMREDGSLNNSKTTSTMPNEIKAVSDIIKPFSGGLNIEYAGEGLVKDNDAFNNYGIKNKYILLFKAEDKYQNAADFYYAYDPYNCNVFKLHYNLKVEYLGQGAKTNTVNQEQAEEITQKYLEENDINISNLLLGTVDEKNNSYAVICYSKNVDHVNTVETYYVDKTTGLILDAYHSA